MTTARIRCGCGAEFEASDERMNAYEVVHEWVLMQYNKHNCTLPGQLADVCQHAVLRCACGTEFDTTRIRSDHEARV